MKLPTTTSGMMGLIAGIFGAVTLVLVLIAAGLALHTALFLSGSESTVGTVVELDGSMKCSTDDNNRQTCRTVYAPRVRFTTADGHDVDYLSRSATNPPRYHEGDQVEIRYDPDQPEKARIYAFVDLWLAPTIVAGVGLIFALVAGGLALIGRRLRTPKDPSGWQDPGTLR